MAWNRLCAVLRPSVHLSGYGRALYIRRIGGAWPCWLWSRNGFASPLAALVIRIIAVGGLGVSIELEVRSRTGRMQSVLRAFFAKLPLAAEAAYTWVHPVKGDKIRSREQ